MAFYTLVTFLATSLGATTIAAHQVNNPKLSLRSSQSLIFRSYVAVGLFVEKLRELLMFCGATGDGWNLWSLRCMGRTPRSDCAVLHASSYLWFSKEPEAGD